MRTISYLVCIIMPSITKSSEYVNEYISIQEMRCTDSHPPWGFPQGQGQDGWGRWPACGSDAPHTCSGVGGYASSSFVS